MRFPELPAALPRPSRAARASRALALGLALLVLQGSLAGCFGRFALTRKIYALNESVNDKWLRTILTFVLVVVPVYGVSAFVDWAVFNTIEFWGGKNPIDGQGSDRPVAAPIAPPALSGRAWERGGVAVWISGAGDELWVRTRGPRRAGAQAEAAGALPEWLLFKRSGAAAELRDGAGALIASLEQDSAGTARVRDARGALLQTKSAGEQDALAESLRAGGSALEAELERQGAARLARR